jgi:hypothetical protein
VANGAQKVYTLEKRDYWTSSRVAFAEALMCLYSKRLLSHDTGIIRPFVEATVDRSVTATVGCHRVFDLIALSLVRKIYPIKNSSGLFLRQRAY